MIYFWIVLFVGLWGVGLYLKSNHFKGWILEWKIARKLDSLAKKYGGIQLQNLMIPYNGGTQQIDNILLTDKALYVIEAKNYSGFIYGSIDHESWTMTRKIIKRYKNKKGQNYTKSFINKHSFYNPIKQNETHLKSLKTLLKSPLLKFYNIVVFGKNTWLKEIKTDENHPVMTFRELKSQIQKIENKLPTQATHLDLSEWVDGLYFSNIEDRKLRRIHVKKIKEKYHT